MDWIQRWALRSQAYFREINISEAVHFAGFCSSYPNSVATSGPKERVCMSDSIKEKEKPLNSRDRGRPEFSINCSVVDGVDSFPWQGVLAVKIVAFPFGDAHCLYLMSLFFCTGSKLLDTGASTGTRRWRNTGP